MQHVHRELSEQTKHELTEYEREGAWYLDGRDEGRSEGLAEGRRSSLLLLLGSHGLELDPVQRARVDACTDPDQLQRWFERALRATSLADIFASED